ncbi:metallophosphoesterase [Candidatus Woesearchaeota archaeon]|nr:metallophosphoesterase [Candidatus Woesearchaeota archaeon]
MKRNMQKNWWYLIIALIILSSCFSLKERIINDQRYKENGAVFAQKTPDINNVAVFGVISDAHGNINRVQKFLDEFRKQNVEYIIFTGDIAEHFRKTPEMLSDEEQIYQLISLAADAGLPVFVIPGNHDPKEAYFSALTRVNKNNVIDGTTFRYFDGDDADVAFVPGYFENWRTVANGFVFSQKDIGILKPLIKKAKDPIVLVSHSPPKGKTENAIDIAYGAGNVGSEELAQLINTEKIFFGIFGHIHEAGAKAVTLSEKTILENNWSGELYLNAATAIPWTLNDGRVHAGVAAIMWVEKNRAKYKIIR